MASRSVARMEILLRFATEGMEVVQGRVRNTFGGIDDQLGRTQGRVDRLGTSFQQMAGAFVAMGVGRQALGMLTGFLQPALTLEMAMAELPQLLAEAKRGLAVIL